ncbi:MAG: YezD family protein [Verrucomicrobiales bacterium]|nr:YezD family protein [Verrucomicrobiales bacterium]
MTTPDTRPDASANTSAAAQKPSPSAASGLLPRDVAESIVLALEGLDFGSVEITVHQGRVVQIERHQRIRLANDSNPKPGLSPSRKSP